MRGAKKSTVVSVAALVLLFTFLLNGCNLDYNPQILQSSQQRETSHTDKQPDSSKPAVLVELPELILPTAAGIAVEKNEQAIIDFSNKNDGYIMAKYLEQTEMNIRVRITAPDEVIYTYAILPGHDFDVFPLSAGDGIYEIGIFRQVEGTRFSMVVSTIIDVTLTDEFAPFLRPNQFVNFSQDSDVVRKAAELTVDAEAFMDRVAAIYHFVITHITYDTELAEAVQRGEVPNTYVPDVDLVLARGKGICFDYAALMAAMLRSQGIPTKLVIGYTTDVRHAWISVYSEEEGWLDDIIFFDGNQWWLVDPTFAASGSAASLAKFIGEGTNYTATHIH